MRPYHLCNVHVYILIYKMQKAKKKKTYTQKKKKKRQIKYDTGKKERSLKKKIHALYLQSDADENIINANKNK